MTNEEHLEEILFVAHQNNLHKQIISEVDEILLLDKNLKFYDAVLKVFYSYVKSGNISY
jgi:hypothetical protein